MIYNYTKQCGIMHGSVLFTRARVKQAVYKHVYKVSLLLHYEPVVAVFSQLSRFTGQGLPHIVHVICISATVGVVTGGVVTVAALIPFRLVVAGTSGVVLSAASCWATCS